MTFTPDLFMPMFIQNAGIGGILIIAVVVLVLFGRGKISTLMGEVGKGISSFKKGVAEETKEIAEEAADVVEGKEKDDA